MQPDTNCFVLKATKYGFKQRHIKRTGGFIDVSGTSDGNIDIQSIPAPIKPLQTHLKQITEDIKNISSSIRDDQQEEQVKFKFD